MFELMLATAFFAGLLGSGHCLGMCGGIVTALGAAPGPGRRTWRPVLHQGGRLAGYAVVGMLAGLLGSGAGYAHAVAGWGAVLRLCGALVVILIGLQISLGNGQSSRWIRAAERFGGRLWNTLSMRARRLLPTRPVWRALTVGILWGWMPCGMVYTALLAAMAAGGGLQGAAVMLAFGAGTLPALVGLGHASAWLPRRDSAPARVLGGVIVACGLWSAGMPIAQLTGHHGQHSMPGMNMDAKMPAGMKM